MTLVLRPLSLSPNSSTIHPYAHTQCLLPLLPPPPPPQVLYDLGVVSTKEPFGRLVSQGMILGEVEYSYTVNAQGAACSEDAHDAVTVRVSVCGCVVGGGEGRRAIRGEG